MPRPNRTKTQYGDMLYCPACKKPVFVAVVSGWYVFYCPTCRKMHTHGQCHFVRIELIVTSLKKGDQSNEKTREEHAQGRLACPTRG